MSNFGLASSGVAKNSFWGLLSTIFQSLFLSLFFIILARQYNTVQFANFLIATSIYQLVVAFSSMGLGQWFIREFKQQANNSEFTRKFLKIQIGLGFIFYFITLGLSLILYSEGEIRWLIIILATNIIFDNLIYGIRNLNIAESKQKQTAIILFIDGFLKFLIACFLIVYPFSVIILSVLIILVRIITVNLFIKLGSSHNMTFKSLWYAPVYLPDLKKQIFSNWLFIIIGGVSVIYWRISTVMISKMLTLQDVADYEISYKLFTIFLIIPAVISASVYPQFIRYFNFQEYSSLRNLYNKILVGYTGFAMLSYAFVYTFADFIIPFAFGNGFSGAISCVKLMFLTFLIFPSILIQANLIVAMRLERMDMWFNVICLISILAGGLIGLYWFQSLDSINYAILISFIIFHILQDILLIKKQMASARNCILVYLSLAVFVITYQFFINNFNSYLVFVFFTLLLISSSFVLVRPTFGTSRANRKELNSF